MAQQFDCPKTETELRTLLDELYQQSRKARQGGKYPAFQRLTGNYVSRNNDCDCNSQYQEQSWE